MLDTETFDTLSKLRDIFAADGYTNYMRKTVDQMDDPLYFMRTVE